MNFREITRGELVEDYICNKLIANLSPGDKMPSERDLAKQLGVALQTINKIYVSLTDRGRLFRKKGLGTYIAIPQLQGKCLRYILDSPKLTDKNYTANWYNAYFIHQALITKAHQDGLFVETYYKDVNYRDKITNEQLLKELILPNIVGYAFNFYCDNEFMKDIIQILKVNGIAVCCRSFTPLDYCSSVVGQMQNGVRIAVEDLLRQGCQHIAYFGEMCMNSGYENVRRSGFEQAFANFNRIPDQSMYCNTFISTQDGYQAAKQLIQSGKKFDAVFAGTDTIAYGILQAFSEHNIRVPEDVLIVASDDLPDNIKQYPQLSSVAYPLDDLGMTMCEMLIDEIRNNDHTVKTKYLPCTYMKRKSSSK